MTDPSQPIPLFYFGARNAPHPSTWVDPNAFWGAGMGTGARYVVDQRRPMLGQLDYQWAGTYPKRQWDPMRYYRGFPAAPDVNQERLGTNMRAQSEFNELGYQNVLMRDNGVPLGGELASTPQYVFAGPIQAGYTSFMRPIARRETMPAVLPDWRNIALTQRAAEYGVYGGGPYSDPPLQPPGFKTVKPALSGNWPLYQYQPTRPAQLPPDEGQDPMMANTNPGIPPSPAVHVRSNNQHGERKMYNQWTSPNAVARATMNNPLSNPMIGGGPGYGGGLNRAMSGMPGAVGYASNPGIPGVSLHVGAPFSSRAWMQSVGSVGGPVHNPGIPGVPLTVAPPPSVADWMQRVATGPARYANPTGNPCKEGYVECGSGVNKSCCSIAMGGCDDPLCGVAEMQARGGGTTPTRGALGFAAAGRRGAPLGGGRHGSPQSYSDACTHNDDCGPLETCVNGVCTQVKPQGRAGYQSGGQARGCKPPSKGCGTGRKWSKELCKCVNLPISLPPDTGDPLGRPSRPGASLAAPGGRGAGRRRPPPVCDPATHHRCGSFCCKNIQRSGTGGVARTVPGRRGAAVTQAIVANPARRGSYAVRSMVSSGPQQARGFFCRLFPNSPRCSSISAAPHAGCRWNVTTQTWHCPSEGQQAGPQLSAGRRRNPGVVPVGVYPQWSGSAAHNRGTIAKAINPDACCDGCAISGGSCGGGCGCKGKCDGSCSGAHRHHNP